MATYSAARTQHQTLTANTVDTVTLDADYNEVEVVNRASSGDIYFTADGTTPVVAAAGTFIVRAGEALTTDPPTSGNSVIKLISTSACPYSVTGAA